MPVHTHPRPTVRGVFVLATAALLSVGLAGCSGGDDDTYKTWVAEGGREHTLAIGKDIITLISLSGEGRSSTAHRCQEVLDHVKAAKAYRKLPDETARGYWETALDKVESTATHCVQNKNEGMTGGTVLSEAAEAQSAFSSLTISIHRLTKSNS
ncbi:MULTISPECIES: hypothetical protein [unclassified Kitasatospora]|uniref:hypothetical protein n=1 Tax=unclassified Kitasatospora TaxID=2633591 RepID=UPI000708BF9E|nr:MULTISPECIES: hypothetical protein [unclassified Kitasatospora]KQV14591.1 hypothetical protein ASC99_31035 [Kitasatospora sp. Root107]KRB68131.1 hypothetical protein ASE03_29745 [Kitasatospora sp. Root187]